MKKIILSFIILFSLAFTNLLKAQNEDINALFQKFLEYNSAGDLVNAEDVLLLIIDSKKSIPDWYRGSIFSNLGAIYTMMGRYEDAIESDNKAEDLLKENSQESPELAIIYNNKAYIFNIKKSYDLAIEYLEKSIRIYNNLTSKGNKRALQNLSAAYLNIGIAYYETKNFEAALEYLNKSAELKVKNYLLGLPLVYLNIAKTYAKSDNFDEAEIYFLKSIKEFNKENGPDYYRTTSVLFDYGLFLRSTGRNSESLASLQKALSICRKNYGEKHTLISLSYKLTGDHFVIQNSYDSALYYYQKSLIAVVTDFNDTDIFSNPSIDSAIFDIRLLDNLKSKARALELLAGQQKDPALKLRTTQKSLQTIELAMQLIDRIRNNYLSEESRIYLAENEKETYVFATHLAYNLVTLTNSDSAGLKMYTIARKAKAAILRNEITGNELFYSVGIPDSLQNKQNILSTDIAAYNNLILEEIRKNDPDNKKISLWKDALFDKNRENEKLAELINSEFPQYQELLQKTEPVSLSEIQKHLSKDETVIDYLLSDPDSGGKRKLYTFLISRDRLEFRESGLDSLFIYSAGFIREWDLRAQSDTKPGYSFRSYTAALYYMYENLIKPVEGLLAGKRLIIIPDEEIAWLPFDAFLKTKPAPGQTDYEGLNYLINDYTFSYGYSSSLIFRKEPELKGGEVVYAFSPDYGDKDLEGNGQDRLQGAGAEINAIFKLFRGRKFTGENATESNFKEMIRNPAIFHMAMHSLSDSSNSRYSYMLFDQGTDSINDGKLFNYEISISRIKSPMVVLSACNSGTGTLYHGEGLMSLARGFTLAGASSVVRTAWKVNDEASAAIISRFYFHLSKGNPKDVAMRLAKLEYLKDNPPLYANPYYWAAYEVMGDNSPISLNSKRMFFVVIVILILAAGLLMIYFKRRSIVSARSL